MRRILAAMAGLLALLLALSGCGPLFDEETPISVYATFYPIYALTDGLMAGIPNATLHCLAQPQDGCLRNYQLSDWDMSLLASADAVIAGGRGLESFEGALMRWGESGPAVSAVLYNLELYNQSSAGGEEGESHLSGANPHLYMSIDGAAGIVESLSASLISLDPDFADSYLANAEDALDRLEALKARAREIVGDVAGRKVILMNEALIYVARDYGLEAADWIDRESGSAFYDDELADCLARLEKTGARVILIERQAPKAFVDALEAAGFAVARLDVLSTHREGEGFDTYLEAQLANAEALRAALAAVPDDRTGDPPPVDNAWRSH